MACPLLSVSFHIAWPLRLGIASTCLSCFRHPELLLKSVRVFHTCSVEQANDLLREARCSFGSRRPIMTTSAINATMAPTATRIQNMVAPSLVFIYLLVP